MRKLMLGLVAMLGIAASSQAGPIQADIVFIIDTSGSMGDDINQVKARIGQFNTALVNAGIDPNYALVRFGGANTLIQQRTDFATFSAPGSPFSNLSANGGANEEGSAATLVALANVNFRPGAVKNFILITDEDDDSTVAQFNAANLGLTNGNVLFNVIGNPADGNTNQRYLPMATNNGGMLFNIISFRTNPDPFFDNFIDVKVGEIIDASPVPEPISMIVFGSLVVGGIVAVRRRMGKAAA